MDRTLEKHGEEESFIFKFHYRLCDAWTWATCGDRLCMPLWSKLNLLFSMAYFVVPALFSFALLFYIQSSQIINYSSCLHCALVCLTPAVLWIMLLFFDGQYFACAKTSWEGLTVHTDITASTTWCQPLGTPDNSTEKQMAFFSYRNNSQVSMIMKSNCCYIYVLCVFLIFSLSL